MQILLADDNAPLCRLLCTMLEAHDGWTVSTVTDGAKAIAEAIRTRPDFVILDLVMPILNGLEAAREITAALPETPIILHTLHGSSLVDVDARRAGVWKVVSKAEAHKLLAAIEELLAEKERRQHAPSVDALPPPSPAITVSPEVLANSAHLPQQPPETAPTPIQASAPATPSRDH